ncbi:MAG: nucleotidyl transferase AbiEii/AbiGii toxin family protein [Thermoplasmata archaeon]
MVTVDSVDLSGAVGEGFPQATAEKVHRLLGILREIQTVRSTRGRFTLKGGTALNVFHLPKVPRLSVDLDLMATGYPGAAAGTALHERVIEVTERLVHRMGYTVAKSETPAACTLECRYRNLLEGADQVKIDLDILNRQTLLPPRDLRGPALFLADDLVFPVLSEAELLGQKLVAVAYRAHARDLYDMHAMLRSGWHRRARARQMYLSYSFLHDSAWHRLNYPVRLDVEYRVGLLEDVLRAGEVAPRLTEIREVARTTLEGSDPPFTAANAVEQSLRRRLLTGDRTAFADIVGERNVARRRKLARHPGLEWRLRQSSRSTA